MIFLLFAGWLLLLVKSQQDQANVKIVLGPVQPEPSNKTYSSYIAYQNKTVTALFNIDLNSHLTCIPTQIKAFKGHGYNETSHQVQFFRMPIVITNTDISILHILNADISNYYPKQQITSYIEYLPKFMTGNVAPGKKLQFNVVHRCDAYMNNRNYWTVQELQITFTNRQTITLQYQFICDQDYRPSKFDWSNVLLVLFECLSILFLARFGKVFAIKLIIRWEPPQVGGPQTVEDDHIFQGFYLNIFHALFYTVMLVLSLYLALKYQVAAESIMENVVQVFCFLFVAYFFDEIICSTEIQALTHRIICFRLSDLISLIIASIVIASYIIYDKPWFVSDFITFCMLGSLVKLFKLKSLRDGIKFYCPILLLDIIVCIYLTFTIRYEWDNVAMKYFNTPLSAQIPYFFYLYKRKCGWVSFFNILFPGFFVGYSYRFDTCKKTFFWLFCGMQLWLLFQFLTSLPLPVGLFTGIPMISLTILLSFQRGEFKSFWQGIFYDSLVISPFGDNLQLADKICEINLYNKKKYDQQKDEVQPQLNNSNLVQNQSGQLQLQDNLFQGLDMKK